jgi:hypothetical protein
MQLIRISQIGAELVTPNLAMLIIIIICLIGISASGMAQESKKAIRAPRVVHLVLFKFLDQADSSRIGQLMAHIKGLQSKISGIQSTSFGKNFSGRSKGYTHAVCINFTDQAALKNFITDPLHQQLIKDFIKPILADMIVVDYADDTNLY